MNRIYWDLDKISMLTDSMDASSHSHGMMQFFVCLKDSLNIKVKGKKIETSCILVNKNIKHSFNTENQICFTSVIEPVSSFGIALNTLLGDKDYYIPGENQTVRIRTCLAPMIENFSKESYEKLMTAISECFGWNQSKNSLDDRIVKLLDMLAHCSCDDHSIEEYADKLCLSPSRLSHLFSEEVGIPLKKYLSLHQLERAFENILKGKSITDAAMEADFDSPSHFAFTVKKMMGLPARNTVKNSEFLKVY